MMVGSHFYIGLSERTNQNGAEQVIGFLDKYSLTGSVIELQKVLHLKTGTAYLENNNLVVCGEFVKVDEFQKVPGILQFYMGKNTPQRKEYVMENLV